MDHSDHTNKTESLLFTCLNASYSDCAVFTVQRAEIRFTQSTLDSVSFETQTVHDDEKDHRSQHFRRYGHGTSLQQKPQ
jgi:hypothetical protein